MTDPILELDGHRAVVTGGASGIGLATAVMMASRGARVSILDVAPAPPSWGGHWARCDVSDGSSVTGAVQAALDHLGGLDILVNNAGIGSEGTVEDNPDEEWLRVFNINVMGIVRVTRAALPTLRSSSHPVVVNTCSVAADVGLVKRAVYSASKGAVLSLTRAMAADHLAEGVRVNCVSPGTADTPWVQRLLDAAPDPVAERAALVARQPHGRLVSPEEVATAICYLAGPGAGSTTATELIVDGGLFNLRIPPTGSR